MGGLRLAHHNRRGGLPVLVRILETCETTRGTVERGAVIALPKGEAQQLVQCQRAEPERELIETASFIRPLSHHKRKQRHKRASDAERLATNDRANQ